MSNSISLSELHGVAISPRAQDEGFCDNLPSDAINDDVFFDTSNESEKVSWPLNSYFFYEILLVVIARYPIVHSIYFFMSKSIALKWVHILDNKSELNQK